MADDDEKKSEHSLEGLSQQEIAALRDVLSRLEWQLFQSVVSRLKTIAIVAGGILTLFGFASFATIRSAAVDAAANKLASDSTVRDQVVSEATLKLNKVNQVLKKSIDLEQQLDAEQARAMRIVGTDLDQLLSMVRQLEEEITTKTTEAPNAKP